MEGLDLETTRLQVQCSNEGLMLKMSALKLFTVANLHFINSVDNTKLPCYTPPLTQHHSFFRNLPPLTTQSHYNFEWKIGNSQGSLNINPFSPMISLVILITVDHTILMLLVERICYWINCQSPTVVDIFLYSHHLSA